MDKQITKYMIDRALYWRPKSNIGTTQQIILEPFNFFRDESAWDSTLNAILLKRSMDFVMDTYFHDDATEKEKDTGMALLVNLFPPGDRVIKFTFKSFPKLDKEI